MFNLFRNQELCGFELNAAQKYQNQKEASQKEQPRMNLILIAFILLFLSRAGN